MRHPTRGPGLVLRLLDGGKRALVALDARPGLPVVLPIEGLAGERRASEAADLEPRMSAEEGPRGGWMEEVAGRGGPDRQSLEALRLGVVPRRGLDTITVGRQREIAHLEELLDRKSGLALLSGGYGSGKTHMLELCEAEALHRGLPVARATFDPVEVPPSHPLRLYGALVAGLSWPDSPARGLAPLLERLQGSAAHLEGARAHRWLSPALFAQGALPPEEAARVIEYVSGWTRDEAAALQLLLRHAGWRGPGLLALPDYRTFGQVMASLLGALATWARDAGWGGLVVLIDEAELLEQLGSVGRQMAENVLRYLAIATLPPGDLAFDPSEVYRGGQAVHRAVSARFAEGQPLVVVAAFTPDPQIDRALAAIVPAGRARLDLEPVRPSLLPVLADKVEGLVRAVHPELRPEPAHAAAVGRALSLAFREGQITSSRQAARFVVEFWDLYRLSPARALRALRP